MATTVINVTTVINAGELATSAANKVANVKSGTEGIRGRVDAKVLSRNNVGNRLRTVAGEAASIEQQIRRIQQTAQRGAETYYSVDTRLKISSVR